MPGLLESLKAGFDALPAPLGALIGRDALVALAFAKPRAGSYALPGGRELVDVDPAIARAFGEH